MIFTVYLSILFFSRRYSREQQSSQNGQSLLPLLSQRVASGPHVIKFAVRWSQDSKSVSTSHYLSEFLTFIHTQNLHHLHLHLPLFTPKQYQPFALLQWHSHASSSHSSLCWPLWSSHTRSPVCCFYPPLYEQTLTEFTSDCTSMCYKKALGLTECRQYANHAECLCDAPNIEVCAQVPGLLEHGSPFEGVQ